MHMTDDNAGVLDHGGKGGSSLAPGLRGDEVGGRGAAAAQGVPSKKRVVKPAAPKIGDAREIVEGGQIFAAGENVEKAVMGKAPAALFDAPQKVRRLNTSKSAAAKVRQSINGAFLEDFQAVWEDVGESCLRRTAFYSPDKLAKMALELLPKQMDITHTSIQDMENEHLDQLLELTGKLISGGSAGFAPEIGGGETEKA